MKKELIKCKNKTKIAFRDGELVCEVDDSEMVLQVGWYTFKYGWFRRLFRMRPLIKHVVKDIDTCEFKKGEKLYLDPNNAGGLISD